MTIENQNWTMYQGEDFVIRATLYKDKKKTPEPLGSTYIIWSLYSDPDRVLKLSKSTSTSDLTITNATNGAIEFTLDSSETADLPVGYYYHELWLTKAGKDILEFKGKVKLKEGHAP